MVTALNVAFICTEKLPVPPVDGGAIQIYIEGILPYLKDHHKITVFCISSTKLPDREVKDGVKYIRVPGGSQPEFIANVINAMDSSYDLIQIFNRPKWVLDIRERFPKTKISLSLHNEMFEPKKIPPPSAAKCIETVEYINNVSKFIAGGVSALYPEAKDKLNVIYSGADIEKYKPNWSKEGLANKTNLKKKYNIQNYKVVLFVGRLSEKKGVHVLLEAMKDIMNKYPKVALVIVGSKWFGGNKVDDYTKSLITISKELTGPIVFTGFLPPSEVYAHYNMADIFVCPSQWREPLARVHYEAMAAGIPIITTNRGGNAEVVSGLGNGYVIDDYTNPLAFVKYIDYLLKNPDIAMQIGQKGRRLAEERHSWDKVALNVLNAINSVQK